MVAAGLGLLDILFLDENMFQQVIMSCTKDIVTKFVDFLYGME